MQHELTRGPAREGHGASAAPRSVVRSELLRGLEAALLFLLWASPARAVPSFARQTGMPCTTCHTAFPQLTPFGRYFKLTGYTLAGGGTHPGSGLPTIYESARIAANLIDKNE